MEDNESVPVKPKQLIEDQRELLKQPFNFYTFAVEINSEKRVDVMSKIYNRILEKKLIDAYEQIDGFIAEIKPSRAMNKEFKQTEEMSLKKIEELKIKYEIAVEDRKADKVAFDKRLNLLIRDFVSVYKKLAHEFI